MNRKSFMVTMDVPEGVGVTAEEIAAALNQVMTDPQFNYDLMDELDIGSSDLVPAVVRVGCAHSDGDRWAVSYKKG